MKPIKPSEVMVKKQGKLPDKVIEAFNELIVQHWDGYTSRIPQDDVVKLIVSKVGCTRSHVFDNGWLNIKDIYRKEGWKVAYDKPSYCDDCSAVFTFRV